MPTIRMPVQPPAPCHHPTEPSQETYPVRMRDKMDPASRPEHPNGSEFMGLDTVSSRDPSGNDSSQVQASAAMVPGVLARTRTHRMVDETTDEEAEIVLEAFCRLNEREGPDQALGKAFVRDI